MAAKKRSSTATAVNRGRRAEDARARWRVVDDERGAEEALAWHRKYMGAPGGPYSDEFDVPLAYGGQVALLMRADLQTTEGVDRLLARFTRFEKRAAPPTIEQLQLAREMAGAISLAMTAGNNPVLWEQLRDAHAAIFTRADGRRAAVGAIAELVKHRRRCEALSPERRGKLRARTDERFDQLVKEACAALASLDARFEAVSHDKLKVLASTRKLEPLGIVTKLSIETGAFDTTPYKHETKAQTVKRVKTTYEQALSAARRKYQAADAVLTKQHS